LVSVSLVTVTDAADFDLQSVLETRASLPAPPIAAEVVSFRRGQSADEVQEGCLHFCASVFGYKRTRRFQGRVLQRAFNGQPVIGISATGSGKSFCFWLPALLKPGLTLVVCPLRSLMRDQILALRNHGIASAEFINSDVGAAAQRRILNEAKLGYVRLLYIAPERLRIRRFMDQLRELQQVVPINFMVIDEAHCISEWGHDFRPAYLVLPHVYAALAEENPSLGLIALTATAGQLVEQDMLEVLKLRGGEGGNVVRDPGADRRRFSYQMIEVPPGEKTEVFRRVLSDHLPKALRQRSLRDLLNLRHGDGDKAVGLVFCIYADPHGQHSTHDGIAHYLHVTKAVVEPDPQNGSLEFAEAAFSTGRVRGFSSKTPTLCPNCYSYDYSRLDIGPNDDEEALPDDEAADPAGGPPGMKQCANCGYTFPAASAHVPRQWTAVTTENQVAFKESRLDILVATKGFGMGIDKASVRFVVHTALPSGLESWYQEVGRGGRDEERAHIVLLFDPPTESCRTALAGDRRPTCTYWNCPHGRDSLCDYGKQHVFIRSSYPGAESDAVASLWVLAQLLAATGPQVQIPSSRAWLSRHELAIHRLKTLGLIEDYVVDYGQPPRFTLARGTALEAAAPAALAQLHLRMESRLEQHFTRCTDRAGRDTVQELERVSGKYRKLEDLESRAANRLRDTIPFGTYAPLFDLVYRYLLVLLDHTYDEVVTMRYNMLWTLYTLATSQKCRREDILPHLLERVQEGYRCGCCDICCPSLEFADERTPPQATLLAAEQENELQQLFASGGFDLSVLSRLREAFSDYPTHQYRQALGVLEGSPHNLPALFFAREFAPTEYYLGHARELLEAANRRPVALSDVRALYASTRTEHKAELLHTLNEAYSACASVDGWRFLAEEARKAEYEGTPQLRLMRECLEFMLLVDNEMPKASESMRRKVGELEEALYA
jgi:ATP-dependent DNA helicase RecQ